jgi:hypothetical protein
VDVLTLQEKRPAARQPGRRLFQRCRRLSDSGDTDES